MAVSKVNLVVLGFLNIKPMYGYEIVQEIEKKPLVLWVGVKMPSVYRALRRLKKKGYITGEKVIQENNPPRTVYTLTDRGVEYFRKILKQYLKSEELFGFWMGVRFIKGVITKDFFMKILKKRKQLTKTWIENHGKKVEELEHKFGELPFYAYTLMDSGKKHLQIELKTINKLITEASKPENAHIFLKEDK